MLIFWLKKLAGANFTRLCNYELEKRKFDDKDETDYYDSLEFCADLVWNGEFVLDVTIVRIFTLTLSPEYQVIMEKLQHRVARQERNLCNRVKAILTPLYWFVNVVIVGSMAYGTALQGTSDLDLQVNCYFELSTIEFQLVPP